MHIIISGSFYFGNGNDELVCKIIFLCHNNSFQFALPILFDFR